MNQPTYDPNPGNYNVGAPKKSGMSGLKIALIVAGVCFFFFLVLAGAVGYLVSQTFYDSDVMKSVVSKDRVTEIQVPSNWKELTGPDRNLEASLQYCNIFAETYGLIMTESKREFAEALEVPEDECTIEKFANLLIDTMSEGGFTAGPSEPVTINGLKGVRVKMRTDIDGIKISYLVTFLDGKENYHQVHCWTLQSREERNMPTLEKVANSFREL